MSQAPGCECYIFAPIRHRVPAQFRVVLVEEFQVLLGQVSLGLKDDVKGAGRMSFGKYEEVVFLQDLMVKNQEDIQAGEVAADMPGAALEMHL